ncbi:hypothetical protein [Serratia sp. CY76391]|uniref:hypothetical protein n=1 Tax=Serratia sp. CY76391 TaxID=3383681 RepID=UPI003F9F63FD
MTLTTERLKWLHDAATELSATKLKMTMRPDELLVLTSELLANREAQPVIVVGDDGGDALAYRRLIQSFAPGTKLYTAPPAPAVVKLPTEFHSDEGVMVRLEQVMAALALIGVKYERKGDACRAAMLENIDKPAPQLDSVVTRHAEQPVSSGYKLVPHVYRELVNSLRDTAVKFSGTEQLRERLNTALSQFIEPDHPHTRTVAPEGSSD